MIEMIKSGIAWATKVTIITLLMLSGGSTGTIGQEIGHEVDELTPEPPGTPAQRLEWFYLPRSYPFDAVPAGAYQRARKSFNAQFGPESGFQQPSSPANMAPQINVGSWQAIGPTPINVGATRYSGRISSVAAHPTNTNTLYIGAAQGGVWKSTDGGSVWVPLTDTECSLAMGDIEIDPVNPNIIYAGTGEQHNSADSYYGCGVLRSTDGGTNWTQMGAAVFDTSTGGAKISRVMVKPNTAGSTTTTTVFAASDFGLYRSTNSGATWTRVLTGVVSDFGISASNENNMLAAVGAAFGGGTNGIYRSTDGGSTWSLVSNGIPAGAASNVGRINFDLRGTTAYAAIQNTANFQLLGIWKSTDTGATWTQLTATNASCGSQCWYDLHIKIAPNNLNTVYMGGVFLYKSTDGGANFTNITSNIHVDQHDLAFHPVLADTIYAANDGGIYKSTNGGTSWVHLNDTLNITQFYAGISVAPSAISPVLGGTQDNHTVRFSGSSAWNYETLQGVGGCDGAFTMIDPTNTNIRYAQCQWQQNAGYSGPRRNDGGNTGTYVRKVNGINAGDRAQFIPPLRMSPTVAARIYFGTYRLYRSNDRGENWSAISTDFTGGGSRSAISMMAEHQVDGNTIYVVTNDGRVWQTSNAQAVTPTWNNRTNGLPNRAFSYIAIDPTNAANAVLTVQGFGTGHVYRTTDSGVTWTNISGNLIDVPVNTVVIDPGEPSTHFWIGTDLGVFRTTNGGTTWTPFNTNLPLMAVFDLLYEPGFGNLYAATHGRGMWRASTASGSASMTVTPNTTFASSGNQGGPFLPNSQTYTITNNGTGSVDYTVSDAASWTDISNATGTIAQGASRAVIVSVNASANTLAQNTYNSTISFVNTTNGAGNTSRLATLTVNSNSGNNDDLINATTLNGTSGSSTLSDNSSYTAQAGERNHYRDRTAVRTAWWKWTAQSDGQMIFNSEGSSVSDTVMSVYVDLNGNNVATLSQIGSDDDTGVGLHGKVWFHAKAGVTYYIAVGAYSTTTNTGSYVLSWERPAGTSAGLVASVLPYARAVLYGQPTQVATAFATVINGIGTEAVNCYIQMPNTPYGSSIFQYQQVNSSNVAVGTVNRPVNIPANSSQGFVFGITPYELLTGTDAELIFDCENRDPVVSQVGLNTFILSSSATPLADMLSIGATASGDGIVNMPANTSVAAFAVSAVNIGASGTIVASVDTGTNTLPVTLYICETDPSNGTCTGTTASQITISAVSNVVKTFAVFVHSNGNIPYDPATNRIFVRFKEGGATRGATTVAVRTQ